MECSFPLGPVGLTCALAFDPEDIAGVGNEGVSGPTDEAVPNGVDG